jgi:hypothetical protein
MDDRQLRRLLAKRVLTPICISKSALIAEYRGNRAYFWCLIIFGLMLAGLALFFVVSIGRGIWEGRIPSTSAMVIIGYTACVVVLAASSYSAIHLLLETPSWIHFEVNETQMTLTARRWAKVFRQVRAPDDLVRAVGGPDVPISVEPIWNVWLEVKDATEPLRVRVHRSQDPMAFGELMAQLKQLTVVEISTAPSQPPSAMN